MIGTARLSSCRTVAARALRVGVTLLAVVVLGACQDSPTASRPVVQIATAEVFPPLASCGGGPISWTFRIHMVNTTSDDVRIDSIGTRGVVRSSSQTDLVGQTAYLRSSLPFTPKPALLRAKDGDVTLLVDLASSCQPIARFNLTWANEDVTLLVYTSSGLYTSLPLNIVHNWLF